jgi:GH25 family lysozyme M1 (1,4-beta-N-acetylmuramidase)
MHRWRSRAWSLLGVVLVAALLPAGEGVAAPPGYSVTGIDVSHWQRTVSWGRVAAGGAKFAYVKATDGINFVDPTFTANYQGAKSAGLYAGAYHFARPDKSTGAAQADYLISHASYSADGRTLPLMLDLEWPPSGSTSPSPCYGRTPAQLVAWAHDFVNRIQARTSRVTTIYTNTNWWRQCMANDAGFGGNPLFIASYTATPPALPAGWHNWTIWQYAAGGALSGDQDVFNGSLAQLGQLAGGAYQPQGYRDDLAWLQPGRLFTFSGTHLSTVASIPMASPHWAGVGDYDHDGHSDLFWYYGSNGTIHMLLGRGQSFTSIGAVRGPGIGRPVWAGVGDFDGDGYDDDLAWLQPGVLFLFTGAHLGTVSAIPLASPTWAGVGDYNHDGRDDLYWYYAGNGSVHVLLSTGRSFRSIGMVRGPGVGAPTWAGVGDFTGDGFADSLAWQQGNVLFTFAGPHVATVGKKVTAYAQWTGVLDYDHNHRDDLVTYSAGSGLLRILLSAGNTFHSAVTVRGPGVGAPIWAAAGSIAGG